MKPHYFLIPITVTLLLFSFNRNENHLSTTNDLKTEMMKHVEIISSESDAYISLVSELPYEAKKTLKETSTQYNLNDLDLWIRPYVNIYFKSDNIDEWNEMEVLELISKDDNLTKEQKVIIAQTMAYGYYLKSKLHDILPVETKTSKADCDAAYTQALARLSRNFVISGSIGVMVGGGIGLAVATAIAYLGLEEAEQDYNRCISRVQ